MFGFLPAMRDLPLKYKFWLVNVISFFGMAMLTLFAMMRKQAALEKAGKPTDFLTVFADEFWAYAGVVLLLMLLVLAGSQLLISFVERHVQTLRQAMQAVEQQNDLSQWVAVHSRDEIGEMAGAFNAMQKSLRKVVDNVKTASGKVKQAVDDIHVAALETSKGMDNQGRSAGQIVSKVEQMMDTSHSVQHQAVQALENTEKANELVRTGNGVVADLTKAFHALATDVQQSSALISRLAEDSKRIGSVLNVIREIADQTNLLALNAAIEAARAGESGRGFAVVADEVRNLARRAGESTEEIRAIVEALQNTTDETVLLMNGSVDRASASEAQATRASQSLGDIERAVTGIRDSNKTINGLAKKQVDIADKLHGDIGEIQTVSVSTQQLSKEFVDSSETLETLAEELLASVAQFQYSKARD